MALPNPHEVFTDRSTQYHNIVIRVSITLML